MAYRNDPLYSGKCKLHCRISGKKCSTNKIPVVLTSQVQAGRVTPDIYEMGRKALELGAISSRDMTFEATLIKCMMLAANKIPYMKWSKFVTSNWAGELTI